MRRRIGWIIGLLGLRASEGNDFGGVAQEWFHCERAGALSHNKTCELRYVMAEER